VVGNLHNLTGDKLYDQSVDSALRISLEQSQYVNVLPELSVQQTLQRMALNPDKTDINRAIGAQVALREGARALILPTVADVGGRVRVTAEVIDPNTQATVYSVSADGLGAQSVLPSLDSVGKQLRGKLGEALAMVSKQSQPLAQVATPDLNALKAYSLGESAYNHADLKSAETYFNEALRIDPHFALAHVMLMKVFDGEDQPAKAQKEIQAAQNDRNRLSARDQLYVDALAAGYISPKRALQKWKLLVSVYPDFFPGLGDYAALLWQYANHFEEAIPYLKQASSPKNPHRATSEYLLGGMYVEAGQFTNALQAFSESVRDGARFQNAFYASAYAAQRRFKDALAAFERGKTSGIVGFDISDSGRHIAIAVDQGDWRDAGELLKAVQARAKPLGPRFVGRYEGTSLSLHSLDGTPAKLQISALTDYLAREEKALSSADQSDRSELKFQIVLAAYLAAHAEDASLAERALIAAGPSSDTDTPVLDSLRSVAKAELARASGKPQDALAILKPLVNGSELYITHVALMTAYMGVQDHAHALAEANWLSTHRGRAYMEGAFLEPFNVAWSNLALLQGAEFASALGKNDEAQRLVSAFEQAWPTARQLPWLEARLSALRRQ
jgi:putative peptide modification system cyclase